MSKAVFLRPHNIYTDYEGDWIQVDQNKKFVNAVSHKSLNSTIEDAVQISAVQPPCSECSPRPFGG